MNEVKYFQGINREGSRDSWRNWGQSIVTGIGGRESAAINGEESGGARKQWQLMAGRSAVVKVGGAQE